MNAKFERRNKLQKYLSLLKPKKRTQDFDYSLRQEDSPPRQDSKPTHPVIGTKHKVWNDPEDDTNIDLAQKNITRKLIKDKTVISQAEFSQRTQEFLVSRQQREFTNWAVQGEGGHENQDGKVFEEEFQEIPTKKTTIEYFGKIKDKHRSVVSDVSWSDDRLISCGLDKVLMISNPRRLDDPSQSYHLKDLPLTKCIFKEGKVYLGSLRRNYGVFDCEKGSTQLYSSTYLSQHKNYSNLRVGDNKLSIFSNKLISIFSLNNQFVGELQANQAVSDVCLEGHDLFATTKNSIYRWDSRTMKILEVVHTGLSNTAVAVCPQMETLMVGTHSGMIYNHRLSPSIKDVTKQISNLVTSVTGISVNNSGSLVAVYSKWKKNALRVIETQSQTVLQSWPSITTKLNFPTTSRFSPNSNYLATGSSNGTVNIYQITC